MVRDNSGTLSRNYRKTSPNHPDHKGKCTVNGVGYWISAWIKEGTNGKFFSLAFTPIDAAPRPASGGTQPPTDYDDSISF